PRLRRETGAVDLGLWARVNEHPETWAAAISNVSVTSRTRSQLPSREEASPESFINEWALSEPVAVPQGGTASLPADIEWRTTAQSDQMGLVNLNAVFPATPGKPRIVFARAELTSETARTIRVGIGYSDDVTVFLNGQPIYAGINGWESRSPGYASFVDPNFESVYLPLRAGRNDLILAVSDDQRFGWGFAVQRASENPPMSTNGKQPS
ncbi:MAG: hypothetical protein KDE14_12285, partial [Rhodobacteraceae bacterium]|nr:hypothetical protein [Paracoccaceae bacterium]